MIKKLLGIFLITMVVSLDAAREREMLLNGNKLFYEGNIPEAFKAYEGITEKGPVLWYNIGVCKFQQNEFLDALIAFRKAERGASRKNLKIVLDAIKMTQSKLGQPHDSDASIVLKRYSSYFSLFWLQIFCIILWWLSFGSIFYSKKYKYIIVVVVWSLFLWSLFSVAGIWWIRSQHRGIVVDDALLFTGTSTSFHEVGSVSKAAQITILNQTEDWYKIKTDNNNITGWIPASKVEPIV